MEGSQASGLTEMWPQVLTLPPAWPLEAWTCLGLCFLVQSGVTAFLLGLEMIPSHNVMTIKEL